jgi:P pilus assembly chaperone PapD
VPGPQGAKGDPGDAADTPTFEAGGSISAKRVIRVENDLAYYADGSDAAQAGKALGISVGAASLGDTVTVRMTGMIDEPTWTLTEGPVYVGANGALTQSVSGLAFVQQIGVAVSPTQININPQLAILH